MAKINNIVRMVKFNKEYDLHELIQRDMESIIGDEDTRCYLLKNIQLIDENNALLYFEEDPDKIMVKFIKRNQTLFANNDADGVFYFALNELQLMDNLGCISLLDQEYDIERIEYKMNEYGIRHANIYLN